MANLYGVANPVIAPVQFSLIGGASVVCPGNSETIIATSPALAALSSGFYYPAIMGMIWLGGITTGLTGLNIYAHIGAGADFLTLNFQATPLVAGAQIYIPLMIYGPSSSVPWQGAGSTVSVSMQPLTNQASAQMPGSYFWASLYRAPDQ